MTVLNAIPTRKPVYPVYVPHAFLHQAIFTTEVVKDIAPQTVHSQGMTRDEMVQKLTGGL